MREIRFPHDVVNADQMAQFDAGSLVPEIDVDLAFEHLAGTRLDALRPQMAAFPFVIATFEHIVDPAYSCFGAHHFQTREAIEHAGENQVGNKLRLNREITRRAVSLPLIRRKPAPARNRQTQTGA